MAKPSYSTKTNNYATPWLKNAMKSIGSSYGASIKQISPNIYDVASAGVSSSRKLVQSIRQNRYTANRVGESLKSNKYVNYMQTAYKNALTDIKTGNFDNQERMMQSMAGDISDSIEEMSGGFTFGDDGASENVSVNVIDGGASAGIASLQSQMKTQAESSIKMQKASMDAFVAVNAASMQQIGQLGAEVVGHLSNINSQLSALVQYNNESMSRYIEASMTYFDKVGSNIEKIANNESDTLTSKDLMKGSKGGFNYSKYKAYVKQQFKDTVSNSSFGMLKTILEDDNMIKMAVSNPMGFLTNGLTSYMMPKVLKTSLESMEKTFNDFMPSLLEQLGDLANDTSSGLLGNFKRALGNTFGVKNDRSASFKDAKIERGPIPFDGETKHAITEVITKELRDQTGYLQIIAEHYNKHAKDKVKKEGEYWDWTTNSYKKMGDVTSQITDLMMKTISESMQDSRFGKAMQGAVDSQKNKKAQAEVQRTLNELYVLMEKETRFLNFDDIVKLVEQTNGSQASVKLLKKWLTDMKKSSDSPLGNVSAAKLNTQNAMKNLRNELRDNPTLYKLFDSDYANLDSIEDIDKELLKQLGLNKRDSRKHSNVKTKGVEYSPSVGKSKVGRSYSENGKTSFGKALTGYAKTAMDNSIDIMRSIMNGDTRGVIEKGANIIAGLVTSLGSKMNTRLFGDKNDQGYRDGGIFSNMANGLTDMIKGLQYKVTGNEYIDSKGVKHSKNDDTVVGRLKEVGNIVKDSVMLKLFGKSKDQNGDYSKTTNGIVDVIGDSFKSAADSFKEFLFGEDSTKEGKDGRRNKGLLQNIKNSFNKGFYGNGHKAKSKDESEFNSSELLGKSVMGTAAGGLLGYLVGGPVVGSILGFATTVATNSEKFKKFFFGEEDGLTLANGKTTKKQGLFGVVNNYLKANLFTPLQRELGYIKEDIVTTVKHDILAPIAFGAEYFAGKLGNFFGDIFNNTKDRVDGAAGFLGTTLQKLFPGVVEAGSNLLTKGLHAAYEVGAKIVRAPGKLLVATVKALGIGDKIKAFFKPVGDMIKGGLRGVFKFTKDVIKDTLGLASKPFRMIGGAIKKGATAVRGKLANTKIGNLASKIAKNYKEYDADLEYNDNLIKEATGGQFDSDSNEARQWLAENSPETLNQLKDSFSLRMKLNKREGKKAHLENKVNRAMGKRSDANAKKIARWTKGQFGEDSEEARQWLRLHDPKKLKELDNEAFSFVEKQKEDARIAKEGRSSRGMNESQLRDARLSTLSEQGQTNGLLARIYDVLFRNSHGGKSQDELDEEEARNVEISNENNRLAGVQNEINSRSGKRAALSNNLKKEIIKDFENAGGYELASKKERRELYKQLADKYKTTISNVEKAIERTGIGNDELNNSAGAAKEDRRVFGSRALGDIANLFDKVRGVFKDKSRQHAEGGFLKKGWNLVGEKGAELVNWVTGKVKNNDETMDVINGVGEASSDENRAARKHALVALYNKSNKKKQQDLSDERAAIAKEELDDLRSDSKRSVLSKAKDAATLMKEKAEEKFRNTMVNLSERTAAATEEHSGLFSKIFGAKKGLITAALLGGFLFLKKYMPGLLSALGSVLKGVGSGVAWLFNLFTGRKDKTYNDDNKDAGEKAAEIAENLTGADLNGDGDSSFNPFMLQSDGSASSLTEPFTKFYLRGGLNILKGGLRAAADKNALTMGDKLLTHVPGFKLGAKVGNAEKKLGAGIYNVGKSIKDGIGGLFGSASKKAATEAGEAAGETLTSTVAKNGQTYYYQMVNGSKKRIGAEAAQELTNAGASWADDAAKSLTKTATSEADDLAKGLAKAGSGKAGAEAAEAGVKKGARKILGEWLEKIAQAITKSAESKLGKGGFSKIVGTIMSKASSGIQKLSDKLLKKTAAEVTETATKGSVGAIATAGLSEAVFATIGAINGASGTAKLFKCKKEDVDGTMILISSVFGALTGTTVGSIADIILTVISACLGIDILSELAVALYKKIVGEDSEKAKAIDDSRTELVSDYEAEREAKIKEQFKAQKAAGLTTAKDEDEFYQQVLNGESKATYKGFDNYNTDVNGSWGDKMMSGIGKGLKATGHGIAKGWTGLFGGEKTLTDKNGNTYTKNADGTYQVHDKDGNDLGYVAKDALPSDLTETKSQGLISKAWNAGKTGVSNLWNKGKEIGGNILTGIGNAKDSIMNGFDKIVKVGKTLPGQIKNYILNKTDKISLGVDEKTPLGKLVGGVENVINFVASGPRNIVGFGIKVKDTFKNVFSKLKNVFNNVGSPILNYVLAKTDDINFSIPEDNPGKPLMDAVASVSKFLLSGPRSISVASRGIKEFIGKAIPAIKDFGSNAFSQAKSYVTGESDSIELGGEDQEGLSPISLVNKVMEIELGIPRAIVCAGKGIKEFIGKAIPAIKDFGSNAFSQAKSYVTGESDSFSVIDTEDELSAPLKIVNWGIEHALNIPRAIVFAGKGIKSLFEKSVSTIKEYGPKAIDSAKSYITGESDSFSIVDSEDELSGPVKLVNWGIEHVLGIPRLIVGAGKGIKTIFDKTVSTVKTVGADLVDQSSNYMTGKSDDITIVKDSDNIFATGINTLVGGLLKLMLSPIRIIVKSFEKAKEIVNKAKDFAKEKIEDIEEFKEDAGEWVGEKWDTAKGVASDAGQAIKSTASNAWNSATGYIGSGIDSVKGAFSWATGGNGKGRKIHGGRGTLNGGTYYEQNNSSWGNMPYNMGYDDGTMGDTGCGPTAAAMAFSDVTGRNYNPLQMASLAKMTGNRDSTGTNWNFINDASNMMGINSTQVIEPSAYTLNAQLDSGNPVILSGTSGGYGSNPYTSAGHYVVAVGKDSNGNVIINDPRGRGYSGRYNINDVASHTGSSWSFSKGGYGSVLEDYTYQQQSKANSNSEQESTNNYIGRASDLIRVASAEVGYVEKANGNELNNKTGNPGKANYTKYGVDMASAFGHPSHDAWCATFVTWVFWKALGCNTGAAKQALYGATTASCSSNYSKFQSAGRILPGNQRPQPGYVVFYTYSHTGLVIGVDGNNFYTIEGNTSSGKSDNNRDGGCVAVKTRKIGDSKVKGFGMTNIAPDANSNGSNISAYQGSDYGTGTYSSGATIAENGSSASSSYDGGTSTGSSSSGGVWSKLTSFIGNFFSSFADKALGGLASGNWNSDYSDVLSGLSGSSSSSATSNYDGSNYSSGSSYSSDGSYTGSNSSTNYNFGTSSTSNLGSGDTAKLWNYFKGQGYSDKAIAGILGCWTAESSNKSKRIEGDYTSLFKNISGNPFVDVINNREIMDNYTQKLINNYRSNGLKINESAYIVDGHYYPGIGFAQWTGSRSKGLLDYAAKNNLDWGSSDAQLGFMNQELHGSYSNVMSAVENAADPAEASRIFARQYEGNTKEEYFKTRAANANALYSQYANQGGAGTGPARRRYAVIENKKKLRNTGGFGILNNPNLYSSSGSMLSTTPIINNTNINTGNDNMDRLISEVITVLYTIANNTGASSSKLDLLGNLSGKGANIFMNSGDNNTKSILTSSDKQRVTETDLKNHAIIKGGY